MKKTSTKVEVFFIVRGEGSNGLKRDKSFAAAKDAVERSVDATSWSIYYNPGQRICQ